jgi:Ni2+-binding GTPase involved in maturation of urease and hydrogenase
LRSPLLLLSATGTGKTALLLKMIEKLGDEHANLHIAPHHAQIGVAGSALCRVALTRLTLQLMAICAHEADDDPRKQARPPDRTHT